MTPPFRLSFSLEHARQLRDFHVDAIGLGFRTEYLAAFRLVKFSLTYRPLEWGVPESVGPTAGTAYRSGAVDMLGVTYGVRRRERLVFVAGLRFSRTWRPPAS